MTDMENVFAFVPMAQRISLGEEIMPKVIKRFATHLILLQFCSIFCSLNKTKLKTGSLVKFTIRHEITGGFGCHTFNEIQMKCRRRRRGEQERRSMDVAICDRKSPLVECAIQSQLNLTLKTNKKASFFARYFSSRFFPMTRLRLRPIVPFRARI